MIKVAIVGASGYTGVELVRILKNHPEVEISVATSRQYAGKKLADIFPNLQEIVDIELEDVVVENLVDRADVFFTAVPHQTAMNIVPRIMDAGKKVVDLSADFRIRDAAVYEKWYQEHIAPDYIGRGVYGLPELYREAIRNTSLVANPGCYPTSIILGLAPLLSNSIIDPATIIADSKSGTSGAGRAAQTGTLFCEVTDGFKAYKVGNHRHTPEIEQEINALGKSSVAISFTPHLLPISRGILSTVYAGLLKEVTTEDIAALYCKAYDHEKFVRFLGPDKLPSTQFVRGGNYCDISFKLDERTGRIIVISAIDNLVKGAAGQAVQNMNIMCGMEEAAGLEIVPLFP